MKMKFVGILIAFALVFLVPIVTQAGNETHTTAACATSTTTALAAQAFRTYALFVNDSDTDIYLKIGADAVVNEGVRLNSGGGSLELSREFGNLSGSVVNCIHGGSGTKTLLVYEMDTS